MIDVSSISLKAESDIIKELLPLIKVGNAEQQLIILNAKNLINGIRSNKKFSIEDFMQKFSLSTEEGVALMCLAEGLLRIPDSYTAKRLILDKLSGKSWGSFVFKKGKSIRTFVTAFGLYLAGSYSDFITNKNIFTDLLDRLGTSLFLKAIESAILFLSKEFVFAEDMHEATEKIDDYTDYKFSFDLLGESARTYAQADVYYKQYLQAVNQLGAKFPGNEQLGARPNLSVKLTALHPRFELSNFANLEKELMPKVVELVKQVEANNLTITFDAEESTRLDCYMLFLTQLIAREEFKKFNGIGLVIQAYQARSYRMLGMLIKFVKDLGKVINIRLVKGAYWDSEIKHAQEVGMTYYPVFTKKEYTDASYIACAKLLLQHSNVIKPQFATHNALTVAYIKEIAGNKPYEFQKLFGMGNALHEQLTDQRQVRIYAPVGSTNDLLAYLMRRLLENGANSSFVNQVANPDFPIDKLAYDLHDKVINLIDSGRELKLPEDIYPKRKNAMGYDLGHKSNYDYLQEKVKSFFSNSHTAGSVINGKETYDHKHDKDCFAPAKNAEKISSISHVFEKEIKDAISHADAEFNRWSARPVSERAAILRKIADLFEQNKFQLYALLIQEGGKSISDAINEVIEAIDFCRYYANQATHIIQDKLMPGPTGEKNILTWHGRGVYLCISPWNFPLAIFAGQIVAALVSGNTVIAKPADQTSVVANYTVKLMQCQMSALPALLLPGQHARLRLSTKLWQKEKMA
jgi:RHH-type transcriptional regulator, proline utilization regulon repressor / proline dehydrogenase / delta 1-pyrroline-5-carboxylate dehydrogenase